MPRASATSPAPHSARAKNGHSFTHSLTHNNDNHDNKGNNDNHDNNVNNDNVNNDNNDTSLTTRRPDVDGTA